MLKLGVLDAWTAVKWLTSEALALGLTSFFLALGRGDMLGRRIGIVGLVPGRGFDGDGGAAGRGGAMTGAGLLARISFIRRSTMFMLL